MNSETTKNPHSNMKIHNFNSGIIGLWAYESATVEWRSKQETVYFALPKEYRDAICKTNADAFVFGLIQMAAKHNENIVVEGRPVSEELTQHIEDLLIPALNKMGCGSRRIKITADKTNENFGERFGCTGISLGVDSFYSILSNFPERIHDIITIVGSKSLDSLPSPFEGLEPKYCKKEKVASEIGCNLIVATSNIGRLLLDEFSFGQYHSFYHIATVMALMSRFDCYYYATGYSDKDYKLDFKFSSHYDVLISKVVDYSIFKMFTSGGDVTRVQKTEYLSNNRIVQKYLEVCINNKGGTKKGFTNCSVCEKCRRTMVTLDVLGKLDGFSKVFDVDYFRKHRSWYIGEILYATFIMNDLLAKEIYDEMKKRHYPIPALAWYYFIKRGITNQANKLKRLVK